MSRLHAAFLAPWLAACATAEPQATEVIVRVEIDVALGDQIEQVRAEVFSAASGKLYDQGSYALSGRAPGISVTNPFSFSVHKTKADRFLLVVSGFESGSSAPVVQQKVIAYFEERTTVILPITLNRSCYRVECEDAQRSCRAEGPTPGSCEPISQRSDLAPITRGGELPEPMPVDVGSMMGGDVVTAGRADADAGRGTAVAVAEDSAVMRSPTPSLDASAIAPSVDAGACVGGAGCPTRSCQPGQRVMANGASTSCVDCADGTFSTQMNAAQCAPWTVCQGGASEMTPPTRTQDRACVVKPWTIQAGTSLNDKLRGFALDRDGNSYVLMTQQEMDGRESGLPTLRKFDAAGREQWKVEIANAALKGWWGSLAVDGQGRPLLLYSATGGTVLPAPSFLRLYDASGRELANRQVSTGDESPHALAVDGSDNVYLAGGIGPALDVSDGYVAKLNAAGSQLWRRSFGSGRSDECIALAVDASGSAYGLGYTLGTFGSSLGRFNGEAFVIKFDGGGQQQWFQQYGSGVFSERLDLGVADADGSLYVGGFLGGPLLGLTFPGGGGGSYVRKFGPTGNDGWSRVFENSAGADLRALALASNGDLYAVGSVSMAASGQTSAGGRDVLVRRFNATGMDTWTHQFGSSGNEAVDRAAFDRSGALYIAGTTTGSFPGHSVMGIGDIFISKLVVPE